MLHRLQFLGALQVPVKVPGLAPIAEARAHAIYERLQLLRQRVIGRRGIGDQCVAAVGRNGDAIELGRFRRLRSEEHTSELQSLMRISYAVLCLTKKHTTDIQYIIHTPTSL